MVCKGYSAAPQIGAGGETNWSHLPGQEECKSYSTGREKHNSVIKCDNFLHAASLQKAVLGDKRGL